MQTFLPYADFHQTAHVLDRMRLGKQRVEAFQILRTLVGETAGWSNHPAVRMWTGCEGALIDYGITMCLEWKHRGYKDNMLGRLNQYNRFDYILPSWLGWDSFHQSHQSNLLRKLPKHYRQYFNVPDDLPYVWP